MSCCPNTVVVVPSAGATADGVVTAGVVSGGNISLTRSVGGVVVFALGSVDEHSDVDTTSVAPNIGEFLGWNGANWVPTVGGGGSDGVVDGGSVTGGNIVLTRSIGADITFALGSLGEHSDVVLTAPAASQVLSYDGANWINSAVGADESVDGGSVTGGNIVLTRVIGADLTFPLGSIDEHSDVDTTTSAPADGEVLTWVAANNAWEPAAGGGGATARRPFVVIGNLTETSATTVLETDDIWHTGRVVLSDTTLNTVASQFEVVGNVVFGNALHTMAAGTNVSILGGAGHTILGSNNTIAGGINSTVSANSQYSGILTGSANAINPLDTAGREGMAILGGFTNTVGADNSVVGGGSGNDVLSSGLGSSGIFAGDNNTITGNHAFIGAGLTNTITVASGAYIIGGNSNSITAGAALYSVIGAGNTNSIESFSGTSNFIGAGDNNTISNGARSFIGAGQSNTIGGSDACAFGRNVTIGGLASGSFVHNGDATTLTAVTASQFISKAIGGVIFRTDNVTAGLQLAAGGSAWVAISTIERKENLVPFSLPDASQKILGLNVYTGNYKETSDTRLFITAEDWEEQFGDDVTKSVSIIDEKEYLSINTNDVAVATIAALQDALNKIDELEKRISVLESN